MFRPNSSSGGGMSVSAARRSAPVRRWAGPISATGWLPRTMVIVSPRSTASSRSEKCRDASVAVIVFMQLILSDNQIGAYGLRRMTMRTGRCRLSRARLGKLAPTLFWSHNVAADNYADLAQRRCAFTLAFPRGLQRSLAAAF